MGSRVAPVVGLPVGADRPNSHLQVQLQLAAPPPRFRPMSWNPRSALDGAGDARSSRMSGRERWFGGDTGGRGPHVDIQARECVHRPPFEEPQALEDCPIERRVVQRWRRAGPPTCPLLHYRSDVQ